MAKCSGSIAIIEVSDGLTTFYQYAYNTSGTTAPTSGWSQSVPASAAGRFVWRREGTALSYDDVTSWGNEVCLTGATGATGAAGRGISSVTEYYLSTSASSGVTTGTSGWTTTVQGVTSSKKYLWNYTVTTYTDSTTSTSTPVLIGSYGDTGATGATGAKGDKGDVGQGVDSITEEYYLSTSKATQTGGSWVASPPTWSTGKYLWTRSKIVYKNPTDTKYTTPVCDNSWEAVNEIKVGGRNYFSRKGQIAFDQNNEVTLNTYNGVGSFTQFYNLTVPMSVFSGQELTLSFECISPNGSTPIRVYNQNGSPRYLISATNIITPIATSWIKQRINLFVTDLGSSYSEPSSNKIEIYAPDKTGVKIKNVKLEIGNVATDWTQAPEDLEGVVDKSVKTSDVEYYLSTSSTALSGGSWLTTAPQWVDGKFMWTRTKTTLNDGTESYSPSSGGTCIAGAKGATGPKGDKGDTGETGAAAKSVSISAPDLFWHFTGRGALTDAAQAITLTANAVNFTPASYQWYRNNTAISGATTATYTVPSRETGVYKVIVDGTYPASVTVGSVTDGAIEGMYLGILVTAGDAASWTAAYGGYKVPSGNFEGQNLIAGDYYVYNNGGQVTNYYFNGANFEIASGDKLSLFTNAFWDVLNLGTTQASGSFYTLYAKYFMAMEAVIVSLGTSQIHLQTLDGKSGCVYGGSYNADGTCSDTSKAGFWLGANGHFLLNNGTIESNYTEWANGDDPDEDGYTGTAGEPKTGFKLDGPNSIIKAAYGMLGKKFTLYGTLWNDVLKTRLAQTGSLITIPDKDSWLGSTLYSALTDVNSPSTIRLGAYVQGYDDLGGYVSYDNVLYITPMTAISGSVNGDAMAYCSKVGSTQLIWAAQLYHQANLGSGHAFSGSAVIQVTGTYQIAAFIDSSGGNYTDNARLKLSLNSDMSSPFFSYSNGNAGGTTTASVALTAGQTVYFQNYVGYKQSSDIILKLVSTITDGIVLMKADGTKHEYAQTGYSSDVVSVTSPDTYSSASNLSYVSGSSIISLVAAQVNQGVLSGCSGNVVIAGTSRSLTNILYQTTSVLLYWSSTEYQTIAAGGYYDISGSFTPEAQTAAVLTSNLLPLVDADGSGNGNDVGTSSKPYRNGYFKKLFVEAMDELPLADYLKGTTGYTTLPNGMILQWGVVSTGDTTNGHVTFPVAFPTKAVYANLISDWANTTEKGWDYVRSLTTTGFVFVTNAGNPHWLALGY